MQIYFSLADFMGIKGITSASDAEKETLRSYLQRATREIDSICRRRFFPSYQVRRFGIPVTYMDLRNRAHIHSDLQLDADLLEAVRVQVGTGTVIETNETVPVGGLTANATTFTASDVDGQDAQMLDRLPIGAILQMENELSIVLDRDTGTNLVTLQRGANGTMKASHAAGTIIKKHVTTTLQPGIDFHLLDFNIEPKFGIRLVFPNTWAGRYTGLAWRSRYPQIYVTGLWGYHDDAFNRYVDTADPLPTGGIDANDTTWTADNVLGSDANGGVRYRSDALYRIENELVWMTDADEETNDVTVIRGVNGTLPVAHAAGTTVYRFDVIEDIKKACFNIAKTLRDSDDSVGGRQGVTEMSVGVKITYAEDVAETLRRYVRPFVG
jgi:hypothetical protein